MDRMSRSMYRSSRSMYRMPRLMNRSFGLCIECLGQCNNNNNNKGWSVRIPVLGNPDRYRGNAHIGPVRSNGRSAPRLLPGQRTHRPGPVQLAGQHLDRYRGNAHIGPVRSNWQVSTLTSWAGVGFKGKPQSVPNLNLSCWYFIEPCFQEEVNTACNLKAKAFDPSTPK